MYLILSEIGTATAIETCCMHQFDFSPSLIRM